MDFFIEDATSGLMKQLMKRKSHFAAAIPMTNHIKPLDMLRICLLKDINQHIKESNFHLCVYHLDIQKKGF